MIKKIILILSLLFIGGCDVGFGDPFGPGECEKDDPPYGHRYDFVGREDAYDSSGNQIMIPFHFTYNEENDDVFFDGNDNNSFTGVMTSYYVRCGLGSSYKFDLLITSASGPADSLLNKVVKGVYTFSWNTTIAMAIDWSTDSQYPYDYNDQSARRFFFSRPENCCD